MAGIIKIYLSSQKHKAHIRFHLVPVLKGRFGKHTTHTYFQKAYTVFHGVAFDVHYTLDSSSGYFVFHRPV